MKDFLLSNVIFFLAGSVVLLISYLGIPLQTVMQGIIVIVVILLSLFYILFKTVKRKIAILSRWVLLFVLSLLIQLLAISTGGFFSPFLILIHLSTLGIALLLNFQVAVTFLTYTVGVILLGVWITTLSFEALLNDPITLLVLFVTFVAIVPLSKILTDAYHLKDNLLNILSKQITVEEAILADIDELIFVTDIQTKILSINDAVEQTLRKSRSELYQRALFDVLFLRDDSGNIVSNNSLSLNEIITQKKTSTFSNLVLLATPQSLRRVTMQIKPIVGIDNIVEQISFIITRQERATSSNSIFSYIEQSQMNLQALTEELKLKLLEQGEYDLSGRILLISKMTEDIFHVYNLTEKVITENKVLIDVAIICKQTVQRAEEFARTAGVSLDFQLDTSATLNALPHVRNDLETLVKESTGPFYTVSCDPTYFGLLLQKIIELSTLLASGSQGKKVAANITQDSSGVFIAVDTSYQNIKQEEMNEIFKPHYGSLSERENFRFGSGFEGLLILELVHMLVVSFEAIRMDDTVVRFVVKLSKQQE